MLSGNERTAAKSHTDTFPIRLTTNGPVLEIRYDPANPKHQSTITKWIYNVKITEIFFMLIS